MKNYLKIFKLFILTAISLVNVLCNLNSISPKSIDKNPLLPEYNEALYIQEGMGVVDITHGRCIVALGMSRQRVEDTLGAPQSCNDLKECTYYYENEKYNITYMSEKVNKIEVFSKRACAFHVDGEEYKWGAISRDSINQIKKQYGSGREYLNTIFYDSLGIAFSIDPVFSKKIESFIVYEGSITDQLSICEEIKNLYIQEWVCGVDAEGTVVGLFDDRINLENILGQPIDSVNQYLKYSKNNVDYYIEYNTNNVVSRIVFNTNKFQSLMKINGHSGSNISDMTNYPELINKFGEATRKEKDTIYYDFRRVGFILDSSGQKITSVIIYIPEVELCGVSINQVLDQDNDGYPSFFDLSLLTKMKSGIDSFKLQFSYKQSNNTQWNYIDDLPLVINANNGINKNLFRLLQGIDSGYYDLKMSLLFQINGIDTIPRYFLATDTIIYSIRQENEFHDKVSKDYSLKTDIHKIKDYDGDGFMSDFTIYIDGDYELGKSSVLLTMDQFNDSTLQWIEVFKWSNLINISGITDADMVGLQMTGSGYSLKTFRINMISGDNVVVARSILSNLKIESSENDSL